MNLLGCLDTATSGTYRLNGADVETLSDDQLADLRNKEIGFVFQTFQLLPRASALANVELPLVYRGVSRRERRARPSRRCARSGWATACTTGPTSSPAASDSASPSPAPWWASPSLLLADEPTGNLDSQTGEEIIRLFGELNARGHTIILVTHEPRLAARCPRAIKLMDGRVLGDGPGAEVAALQGPRAVGT